MTQTAPQIVHESEAQRQFVRIRLPAKALVEGEVYALRDLSAGGLAILDIEKKYNKGAVLSIELILPFGDFTLDIRLEAQVQNYDAAEKVLGARFVNLSKQQVSLLNHVIKSFIAGEVVESGDLLNAVARDNFVRVRKQNAAEEAATPNFRRQILPLILIVAAGAIGLLIIASSVYKSAFTFGAADGVVEGEIVALEAAEGGVYKSALLPGTVTVKQGDVIGAVTTPLGGTSIVASPCECFVFESLAETGARVRAGQSIVRLVPVDSEPRIKIRIDNIEIQRINMSSRPTISIAGDDLLRTGRVVDIRSSLAGRVEATGLEALQPPFSYVTIQAEQKIPASLIGRPVQATFTTY